MKNNISKAIEEWEDIVGKKNVFYDEKNLNKYEMNVSALERKIPAVVRPKTTEEVQEIVNVANEYLTPLYPISTGKNWGMGSKLPAKDGSTVLDLSRMNKILDVDKKHGYVVVEPGVTQMQLYRYLRDNDVPFILGVTGSGAQSSVLGNAFEKGGEYFGERFTRLSGLEVVLGNGKIINTGFGHYENANNTHVFKLGVGPDITGLFAQSNYGVVTSAGVSLVPKTDEVVAFKCSIYNDKNFPIMVDRFADLRRKGIIANAAHIANDYRTLNALAPALYDYFIGEGYSKEKAREKANKIAKDELATPWSIAGGIMGTKANVKDVKKQIKKAMRGIGDSQFMTDSLLSFGKTMTDAFKFIPFVRKYNALVHAVEPIQEIISKGKPSDMSVKTIYWLVEDAPKNWLEPDYSNSGLLFSLPMVRNDGETAKRAVELTEMTFDKYGFDPLITLNMLTPSGLEGVINNAFDRRDKQQVEAGIKCIRELNHKFMDDGIMLYRVGIESMDLIMDERDTYWQTVRDMKKVLDPNNIISPGRYNLI